MTPAYTATTGRLCCQENIYSRAIAHDMSSRESTEMSACSGEDTEHAPRAPRLEPVRANSRCQTRGHGPGQLKRKNPTRIAFGVKNRRANSSLPENPFPTP